MTMPLKGGVTGMTCYKCSANVCSEASGSKGLILIPTLFASVRKCHNDKTTAKSLKKKQLISKILGNKQCIYIRHFIPAGIV